MGHPLEIPSRPPKGFFARQFDAHSTPEQTAFDIAAGAGLPVLCVLFDPMIFAGYGSLARLRTPCLTLMGVEIAALLLWLGARSRLGKRTALIAGILRVGVVFSFLMGMVLVPFACILTVGVFAFGDGTLRELVFLLGFSPLLTFFVCGRNAHRAWHSVGQTARGSAWLASVVVLLGFGASLILVRQTALVGLRDVRSSDPAVFGHGIEHMQRWDWLINSRAVLVGAWHRTPWEREAYNHAFETLYGFEIDSSM